jgi:hypothetical protein
LAFCPLDMHVSLVFALSPGPWPSPFLLVLFFTITPESVTEVIDEMNKDITECARNSNEDTSWKAKVAF